MGRYDSAGRKFAMRNTMPFMRRVRLGAKTPNITCVYRELALQPLQVHWATLVVRFWKGLVSN